METPLEPWAPPQLNGYRPHRLVAVTPFSDIWLAEDEGLDRAVAIKAFTPKPDADGNIPPFPVDEWRRRFIQEGRIQARLDHPHIVPVVAMGDAVDGRPCLVMQYLPASLRGEIGDDSNSGGNEGDSGLRARAVGPVRTQTVLLQLLSALVELHRRGIVHRDLKPRNLLLAGGVGGRVKLTDFGMAKPPDEAETERGDWFGTREYIAPEQFANASRATGRSDLFSLGVIGIRMLTGHFPDRKRLAAVENLPAAFSGLLIRCLETDPRLRPDAEEMAAQLRAIVLP